MRNGIIQHAKQIGICVYNQVGNVPVHEEVANALSTSVSAIKSLVHRATVTVRAQLPDLRFIAVLATGYDIVDIQAARERGISNPPS